MSVIGSNILAGASGQGAGGYNLTRSLRFRSSASAYLNRTFSSGDRQTWTYSTWVKRGAIGSDDRFLLSSDGAGGFGVVGFIRFNSDDTLTFFFDYNAGSQWRLITTQVFRDPSAWYHIVAVADTTNATSSNRLRLYVNGSQITAFSTANYPSQNGNGTLNQAYSHFIGCYTTNGFHYDGYQAETYFVNAQALTPSSFGETSATTGVWQPKRYTGTYGTNGFYLPFTDNSALTTSSNVGLGKDFSGNGNYWTTNNISITSGSTYDSMTDVPTLTSATASNYCVLNPLDNGGNTLSDGNLTIVSPTSTAPSTRGTFGVSSGKYYWEVTIVSANGSIFGIANSAHTITSDVGATANSWGYLQDGRKANNGSYVSYGASYTNGDVIGVALDMDAGTLTFYKNNTSQGVAYSSLTGTMFPCVSDYSANSCTWNFNFGQRPFAYTPPTGFVALNTYNLPTPTIGATASSQANKYMDVTTYTGNGTAGTNIVNSGGFAPDLVWIKGRTGATNHYLYDIIRGVNKQLLSNATTDELTITDRMTAFNSNGFTVGSSTEVNQNTYAYVGWQWKANGTGVTNTAGSITSTVSANTTSGFSVVTYTGNGSANQTIGHGLNAVPRMIIQKARSNGVYTWNVYHRSLATNQYMEFNSTASVQTSANIWANTAPTSTVFSVGADLGSNKSGDTYVAYCFSEVAGFSKFGSYTGNGSTDGPFVFTGFRPRYLMVKRTDGGTNNWAIFDTARNPNNATGKELFANLSDAEYNGDVTNPNDLLSNGFKIRHVGTAMNASGATYIYMAFAENPFKYSLAR